MEEIIIQNFNCYSTGWQVKKNMITNKFIFVEMQLGCWYPEGQEPEEDEMEETWLETSRKEYDKYSDAHEEMIKYIKFHFSRPYGHGY